ncbi:MAG: methylated-DNA--[protein]-cysteine S-methyltransferase [Thermodesulfobacteriota bacterium]
MEQTFLFSKTIEFERGIFVTAYADRQGLRRISVGLEKKPASRAGRIPPEIKRALDSALSDVSACLKGSGLNPPLRGAVLPEASRFRLRVWRETAKIPHGQTRTYSEIAETAGGVKYRRAVAGALAANIFPILIPCHRVVGAKGAGGYSGGGGAEMKKTLLEVESGARN